jgi:N4-gp56 family major capsid protein
MAEVALASASERQKWVTNYFAEYVRNSGFKPYMGRTNNSIIISKYEMTEEAGKSINIPLITRLKGTGVTGSQTLDGAEEELGNYNCNISLDWRRNAVRVPKSTSYKTELDLFGAAKDMLRTWEAEKLRDDVITAMLSLVTTGDTIVTMSASSAANRNAFNAANTDRLLFGALRSNYSATWATAVGNIDTTNDKCTVASMSLAKRIAKNADPHIRPYKTGDGREYFVAFHGSRTFRDLKADTTMTQANREARSREGNGMDDNPIFQDGDLLYDGIIHREVPEIDDVAANGTYSMNAIGASSADVRPVFLCGAQAVGIAWGQEPTPRTDLTKDYSFRPGVAIEELLGVKKLCFNGVQQGMVSAFFAAAADS